MADVEHQLKVEDSGLEPIAQYIYNKSSRSTDKYQPQQSSPPANTTAPEDTPAPPESSPQERSLENSPFVDSNGNIREWHDGYRPSKRRKKTPRPGETTFRIPVSTEPKVSLTTGTRSKEPYELGNVEASSVNGAGTTTLPSDASSTALATRGGTKMKFRAYGAASAPFTMTTRRGSANQGSSTSVTPSQAMSEQPSGFYQGSFPTQPAADLNVLPEPFENGPKLAWWIAQQVGQLGSPQSSISSNHHVAEMSTQQFYGHGESSQDKKRLTDRERKARWREANIQRNRDNDLRARVNRQARIKFGDLETSEKSDWISTEISRRKHRRGEKQISQAARSGHYPMFHNSEIIRNSLLREDSAWPSQDPVQNLRKLAIDVLFPNLSKSDPIYRSQSTQTLSDTMSRIWPSASDHFQAALKSIAENDLALTTIRSTMEQFVTEEDEDLDVESRPITPRQSDSTTPEHAYIQFISTLNRALSIFRELNELRIRDPSTSVKVSKTARGPRRPSQREHRQHLKDFGISAAQVDEFLLLANRGVAQPDFDDDIALELFGKVLEIEVPSPLGPRDPDIWTLVHSVFDKLLDECIRQPKRGRGTKKEPFNESYVRSRIENIKALLTGIGIGSDRPLNPIDVQAASQFRNRLIGFKDTQSFGADIELPLPRASQTTIPAAQGGHATLQDVQQLTRRVVSELPSPSYSLSSALPLPSTTNPFADDNTALPASRGISPSTSVLFPHPFSSGHNDPGLSSSVSGDNASSLYNTYPQFRPVNAALSFPHKSIALDQADQIPS